jgi:hypothetical protein
MHSIWLSSEGHAIMLGIFAQIALVAILVIGLDFRRFPSAVAFIHVGGIALSTAIMIPCAFWLAHRRCSFVSRIKLPTESEVVAWYCARKRIPAPPLGGTEEELQTWYKQRFAPKKEEEKRDGDDKKDEAEEGPKDDAVVIDLEPIDGRQAPSVADVAEVPRAAAVVIDEKLEKKRKLAEQLEAKKAAQGIAVASWEKYERMCRKFTKSFTLQLRRLIPFDVTLSLWHDSFVAERVCRSYEAEETLMRWYCLSMDKVRTIFALSFFN